MDNSQDYTATGSVHVISDLRVISEKFSVREFVVEVGTGTKYPQLVQFQAANAKLDLLDGLSVGAAVTVHFNLRGRAWEPKDGGDTRYFNSLNAWRIERLGSAPAAPPSAPAAGGGGDEVPF